MSEQPPIASHLDSEAIRDAETTGYLRYASEHRNPILNGTKTLTVRYNFERTFQSGDCIQLRLPDNTVFALAEVTNVSETTIEQFVQESPDGHESYDSPSELVELMQSYYPDSSLSVKSPITRIDHEVCVEM
jgi:hypothetical protein